MKEKTISLDKHKEIVDAYVNEYKEIIKAYEHEIEELKKKIKQLKPKQIEPKKDAIKIRNRYTNEVIFESSNAKNIKEAVEEAVKLKIDLSNADLSKANLSYVDLSGANLSNVYLLHTDLSYADLFFCEMDKKVFKEIAERWFKWKVK